MTNSRFLPGVPPVQSQHSSKKKQKAGAGVYGRNMRETTGTAPNAIAKALDRIFRLHSKEDDKGQEVYKSRTQRDVQFPATRRGG
ncbi:MAG: hypothetical protein ACTHLE_26855 [Agriterribacter sp.]